MPNFSLTISARHNGETVLKSYNFESTNAYPEAFLIQSYQEFNPDFTEIEIVSYSNTSEEISAKTVN